MSDPIRAALERLIEALDDYEPVWGGFPESALAAARAALAEQQALSESQRYLLARWGHQPAPPAEGEVAELAAKLRRLAPHNPLGIADSTITRAADLLLQQEARIAELDQKLEIERMRVVACGAVAMADTPSSAAKARACHPDYWSASADDIARQIDELMRLRAQQTPVPVNERLPGPGDRNTEGKCWWFCTAYPGDWPHWILGNEAFCDPTHWLPAHALPLPQGEVEP